MSTNQEYVLNDTDLIVSKTDLKGIITFINEDFIRIGGFPKTELIGSPHNILRHPDMPKAAFADMWKTLKSGNSWSGIVKNRTKQGGFYWVNADVMPILEHGKIVGYMSVRNKPSVAQISTASNLYRELNAGTSRCKLDAGEIIEPNLWITLSRNFRDLTVKTKLVTLAVAALLSIAIVAGYGSYGLNVIRNASNKSIGEIEEHSKGVNLTRKIQFDFKTQVQEWKNTLLRGQDAAMYTKYHNAFEERAEIVAKELVELSALMADMPEKEFSALATTSIKNHEALMANYHLALKSYQIGNVDSIFAVDTMVKGIDRAFTDDIEKLVVFNQVEINKHFRENETISGEISHDFERNVALMGFVMAAFLIAWSIAVSISIIERLHRAAKLIEDVSEGKQIQVAAYSKNELGKIMKSIKMLAVKYGFETSEERRIANDMLRIKLALDEVSVPVTLSNTQKELIYMNGAGQSLWAEMANELAKRFPDFTVDTMYGKPIGTYLETDQSRTDFAEQAKEPRMMFIDLAGKKLRLTVISVYDERNLYVGRVTQWEDITAEILVQQQISHIVGDATEGDFQGRINIPDKNGFFRELADGLNVLLETCEKSYSDIADIFESLSQGDLTKTISTEYTGEFEIIKNNANNTIYKLTDIVEKIKRITENVNTGSKEIAGSSGDLAHRTNLQTRALEETAANMQELNVTVQGNTESATRANDFVRNSSSVATKGVVVINRVVKTMQDIHESSRKVVDIISVIDGISFQTNILALNAAVEAARAGEQGRGFAVVASEVRSLAQRAAAAAGEIKTLINDSVDKIEDGSKLVIDAGHTMEEIVGSIRTVSQMIAEISAASDEQNMGIKQASHAVIDMEEMTQQNAILVEQSSETADNLREQANELSKAVGYFKMG